MSQQQVDEFAADLFEEADRWESSIKALASDSDMCGPEYFQCVSDYAERLRKIAKQVTPDNIALIRETYEVTTELACNVITHLEKTVFSHRKEPRGLSQKHQHAYDLLWWMVYDHPEVITDENVSGFLQRFEAHPCLAINPDDPEDGNYTAELPARRETIKHKWISAIQFEVKIARAFLDRPKGNLEVAIANARHMFDEQKRCAFLQKRNLIK